MWFMVLTLSYAQTYVHEISVFHLSIFGKYLIL